MPRAPALPVFRRARPLLGTLVEISVSSDGSEAAAHAAIDAAFAEIAEVHRLMSFHEAGSDLDRLNHAAPGDAVQVDARTARVLARALAFAAASDHAFDCAVAATLVRNGTLPALAGVDATALPDTSPPFRVDAAVVTRLRPGLIDLGGIAKGYAVDRAMAVLAPCGFADVVVNAGGDLCHAGHTPLTVHLRNPLDPSDVAVKVVLHNAALASSAVFGVTHDTTRASAIVDARRGRTLAHDGGVSIMAPDCMTADALTKVVLVTGDTAHPLLARCHARVLLFI